MTVEDFIERLKEEILETDTELDSDTRLEDIEEWDSLATVSFLAMGKELGTKSLDSKAVAKAESVGALYELIKDL